MNKLFKIIGRRGAFLLWLGLLDLIYSYGLTHPTSESAKSVTYLFISHVGSIHLWAWLWGITGVLCIINAFRVKDRLGFTAAIFIKVMWAMIFLMGWLMGVVERGYLSVAIWGTFAGLLFLIASWPEPNPKLEVNKKANQNGQ